MTPKFKVHTINNKTITEIQDNTLVIDTPQQFLELIFNMPSEKIILSKENLHESFFDLRSGLAGEILQKVSNYAASLGIVGDFSLYESKSLRDFIFESNKSNRVVFVGTVEDALNRLSQ
jgi:hypothetical protein